jgi:hypothetical protein
MNIVNQYRLTSDLSSIVISGENLEEVLQLLKRQLIEMPTYELLTNLYSENSSTSFLSSESTYTK